LSLAIFGSLCCIVDLREKTSISYDDVEHRAQGLDATLTNNEYLIRITDITAKPRSYAGLLGFSKPTRV
jgi:hypothetical protein